MMTKTAPSDDWPSDFEAQFWKAYPRRVSKIAAMKALAKTRRMGISWATLMDGVSRYAAIQEARGEPQFIKHPATWLNQGCWDDEHPVPTPVPPKPPSFFQQVYGRKDN